MLRIVDIKFEKTPEMCSDSHEKYYKSTSNSQNGILNGAFFTPKDGLSTCNHLLI